MGIVFLYAGLCIPQSRYYGNEDGSAFINQSHLVSCLSASGKSHQLASLCIIIIEKETITPACSLSFPLFFSFKFNSIKRFPPPDVVSRIFLTYSFPICFIALCTTPLKRLIATERKKAKSHITYIFPSSSFNARHKQINIHLWKQASPSIHHRHFGPHNRPHLRCVYVVGLYSAVYSISFSEIYFIIIRVGS